MQISKLWYSGIIAAAEWLLSVKSRADAVVQRAEDAYSSSTNASVVYPDKRAGDFQNATGACSRGDGGSLTPFRQPILERRKPRLKQFIQYTGYILIILLVGFLVWKFHYILGWILIAAVISFVGEPLVRFFDRVHVKRIHLPHWMSTLLALFVILHLFLGLVAVFVPLIVNQAGAISSIDIGKLGEELQGPIAWIDDQMHKTGSIPEDQTLKDFVAANLKSIVNFESMKGLARGFFSAAGGIFLGLFSILFISFFFLKDENMLEEAILLVVPEQHHASTRRVVNDSKRLLKRYFTGILFELICVISLLSLGMWTLGIKNALLIGFFGGIMNIIPYLGPVIGSAIGITLGLTSSLASGDLSDLLPVMVKLISVLAAVQLIDNYVLVPFIYAKSVKSHPLEIFIAVIMGGGIAGLPGMLLAVPVYTVLRVIAREFMRETKVVQKMTEAMDG